MRYDEEIISISKKAASDCHLTQLSTFNDEMTISQVVRFFEKNNVLFTKTMIQNYVRIGVLPPPEQKRYYTRRHLILLSLIDSLKSIYSLEEIKQVLLPILKNTQTFDDDMIDVTKIYEEYSKVFSDSIVKWVKNMPEEIKKISEITEKYTDITEDKKIMDNFMILITMMAQSAATKAMVKAMLDKDNDNNKDNVNM